jgi:hypothetical protein
MKKAFMKNFFLRLLFPAPLLCTLLKPHVPSDLRVSRTEADWDTRSTPESGASLRAKGGTKLLPLVTVLFLALLQQAAIHSKPAASVEEFFGYVNPRTTAGAMAVRRLRGAYDTNAPLWVTVYSWDRGDFLAETGSVDSQNPLAVTNLAFSAGKWKGTNWTYRAGDLVIISSVTKGSNLAEFVGALGGKMPEEATFATIMGRGLDLEDFEDLKNSGETIRGVYQQRIPITGRLESGTGRLEYNLSYRLEGTETARSHHLILQSFPGGGFVPSRLTTWVVHRGATNLESDYEVIALRAAPARSALSPFALYEHAKLLEQAGDNLFSTESGRRIEIKRNPIEVPRSHKALFVAIVVSLTVLAVLLRFLLRLRGGEAKEVTSNKTTTHTN